MHAKKVNKQEHLLNLKILSLPPNYKGKEILKCASLWYVLRASTLRNSNFRKRIRKHPSSAIPSLDTRLVGFQYITLLSQLLIDNKINKKIE